MGRPECGRTLFSGVRCRGAVSATGYCEECGRRPRRETARAQPKPAPLPLLSLPPVRPVGETERLLTEGRTAPSGAVCQKCEQRLRPKGSAVPLPLEGFCPRCGHPYSYAPALAPAERIGAYTVVGCLAHGGQGWVYLARATELSEDAGGEGNASGSEPQHVVVKGLLNRRSEGMKPLARKEARYLYDINHPNVVRIHEYLRHPHDAEDAEHYIVMEDVGGNTLEEILLRTRKGEEPLGRPLDVETVLAYGCKILDALGHLHRLNLGYGDLKPSNVIHTGTEIKIIDLGGVRAFDDETPPVATPGYLAPEMSESPRPRATVAHDIHTVGRTLEELLVYAHRDVPGLGIASLDKALARACAHEPSRRFPDAGTMQGQLRGVAREIRALRGEPSPAEPSAHFNRSERLLGHDLGTIRDLAHWLRVPAPLRRRPRPSPPLGSGVPAADEVAAGLPTTVQDRDDPQAHVFALTSYDPARLIDPEGEGGFSPEACLHNVRLHLQRALERRHSPEAGAEVTAAANELGRAYASAGPAPGQAWKIDWHRGLVALARAAPGGREDEQLREATAHFEAVYDALPGEYAPKLALGYCAERRDAAPESGHTAAEYYRTVLARHPSNGSAAFGLARLALAEGDRRRAVAVLEAVPGDSRDYAGALVAAVRVAAARLSADPRGLPDGDELAGALSRLAAASADQRLQGSSMGTPEALRRLRTEVLEWALDSVLASAHGPGTPFDESFARVFGPLSARVRRRRLADTLRFSEASAPTAERRVRAELAAHYRELSASCPTASEREAFADRANAVRPATLA